MPRGKSLKGRCAYCGTEITKTAARKHLSLCSQRQAAIEKAKQKQTRRETLYYLRVQDAWRSEFWLDLEMRGSSTLKDLDYYLRRIWLECCGHLSRFSVGGWQGDTVPLSRKISDVFTPNTELTHIYDFGTSSHTLIKTIETREGIPTTTRPIALMVRNLMPEARCMECGEAARWLCKECLIEEERWGTLCDRHAETHPHDNYGEPVPLVNSPRLGMCGYDGPAEAPY